MLDRYRSVELASNAVLKPVPSFILYGMQELPVVFFTHREEINHGSYFFRYAVFTEVPIREKPNEPNKGDEQYSR
jgi:hypothetical protein